jgi:hypothetical protein
LIHFLSTENVFFHFDDIIVGDDRVSVGEKVPKIGEEGW